MPLVFGGLLVPALILLGAVVILGMSHTENMWLRSQLEGLANPKGSFLKRLALQPVISLARGLLYVEKRVRAALSRFAASGLPVITRWLLALAGLAHHALKAYSGNAKDFTDALQHLRHTTMPRSINAKVQPVKAQAHAAAVLGGRSISLGQRERKERMRSIDRLRKVVIPLALGFAGIDAFVKGRHAARHHADHTHTIPQIRDRDIPRIHAREKAIEQRLAKHGTRLSRLEKLLGAGVLAGLLVRTIARRWPWLFCRNWKKVGNRICGMHTGLLDFLLGAGVGMFVFRELCHLIELVGAVAARVLPKLIAPLAVAGAALCDGEHSAAPALPLQTTTLPRVDNPLTF